MNQLVTARGPGLPKPEGLRDSRRITEPYELEQHHKGDGGDPPEKEKLAPPCCAQVMFGRSCRGGSSRRSADDGYVQKGLNKSLFAVAKSSLKSARGVCWEARRGFFTEDTGGKACINKEETRTAESTPVVQSRRSADDGYALKGINKTLFSMAKGSLKSARGVRGEGQRVFFTEDTGGKADFDKEEAGTAKTKPVLESRPCPAEARSPMLSDSTAITTLLDDDAPSVFARRDAEDCVLVDFEEGSSAELGLSLLPEIMEGIEASVMPTGAKVHALMPRLGSDSTLNVLNLVRPGDVLAEVNGYRVSNIPFSQVLDLLESPPASIAVATNCGVKNRRAVGMGPESPSTGVATASPSTGGSSPASSSALSLQGLRPFPSGAATLEDKTRLNAPPATDSVKFAYRRDRGFFDEFGRGDSIKSFFKSSMTPTAKSSSKQNLAGRLNDWSRGTPTGKRTQGTRIRSFRRGLSFGSSSPKNSGADLLAPQPPSPSTRPHGWRALGPVTVQPASKTTLRFWTGGRKGVGAAGEKQQSWIGDRTHDRRRSFEVDDLVLDKAMDAGEEEELEPIRLRGVRERYSNASSFFDSDSEGEADEPPRGREMLKRAECDLDGEVSTRSVLGDAAFSGTEANGRDKTVVSATATATVVATSPATATAVAVVSTPTDRALASVEHEEDDVISLSRYLACADRGWPWKGKDIIWAEYVTLGGRHRWLRSEGCRHALLLVREAMYLLELPADAARHHKEQGLETLAQGGWFLELSADELKSVTIPLSPSEMKPHSVYGRAKGDIVFHSKSGGCTWLECTSAGSRDALADVVSAWHSAATESNKPPLEVSWVSIQEAVAILPRGNSGRHIVSLLGERTAHRTW